MLHIHYLPYGQINKERWDDCIDNSVNSLIYAKSFYLDAMAGTWDALVLNEYEAVMPLTWRKKWGVSYLYQPAFTQQLGVFFTHANSNETTKEFLTAAAGRFKFIEINLNFSNQPPEIPGSFSTRNNFILPLSRSYEDIVQSYPGFTIKHLKRAGKANLQFEPSDDFHWVLKLYKDLYSARLPHLTQDDYNNFLLVCNKLKAENKLVVRRVINNAKEILAAGIFFIDGKRLYNVHSCVTQQGKKLQANYFLLNELIREFSNTELLLDFEGSDIPGIAAFYKHFVPLNQPYPHLRMNNLPFYMKWLKK